MLVHVLLILIVLVLRACVLQRFQWQILSSRRRLVILHIRRLRHNLRPNRKLIRNDKVLSGLLGLMEASPRRQSLNTFVHEVSASIPLQLEGLALPLALVEGNLFIIGLLLHLNT